jgi:hypothetical protein
MWCSGFDLYCQWINSLKYTLHCLIYETILDIKKAGLCRIYDLCSGLTKPWRDSLILRTIVNLLIVLIKSLLADPFKTIPLLPLQEHGTRHQALGSRIIGVDTTYQDCVKLEVATDLSSWCWQICCHTNTILEGVSKRAPSLTLWLGPIRLYTSC